MALQRTFRPGYSKQLLDEARNGIGISRYSQEEFDYDKSMVLFIQNLETPEFLLEKMNPDDDLASAKALFEAYKNMSPLQAQDESIWTYLAHADLFPYVQNRNPKVLEKGFSDNKYILEHFFHSFGGLIYHPLAGLWWDVYCTYDPSSENPYKYTDYLFKDYGLRVTYMGRYSLFRNKEEVIGILDFMMENESLFTSHFRQRSRWIMQRFNRIGASRKLISLPRDYYIEELNSLKDTISRINTDEDVISIL